HPVQSALAAGSGVGPRLGVGSVGQVARVPQVADDLVCREAADARPADELAPCLLESVADLRLDLLTTMPHVGQVLAVKVELGTTLLIATPRDVGRAVVRQSGLLPGLENLLEPP